MKNETKILLSVIVPCYNVSSFLNRCLNSIISQDFDNYELIIVDDGSTDNTPTIAKKYEQNHEFIRYFKKENGGIASARNHGLLRAKGEYVCCVDADDYVAENYFCEIFNILNKHKNIDMIMFDFSFVDNNIVKETFNVHRHYGYYKHEDLINILFKNDFFRCITYTYWMVVFKKELLLKHYYKEAKQNLGEDFAVTPECCWNAKDIYFLNKPIYNYERSNPQSDSILNKWKLPQCIQMFSYVARRMDNPITANSLIEIFATRTITTFHKYLFEIREKEGSINYNLFINELSELCLKENYSKDDFNSDLQDLCNFIIKYSDNFKYKAYSKLASKYPKLLYLHVNNNNRILRYKRILGIEKRSTHA